MAQSTLVAANNDEQLSQDEVLFTNEDRITSELVIGLVGPVGSGVSTTAVAIKNNLETQYGYTVDIIRVSEIINQKASLVKGMPVANDDPERVSKLQGVGSALREKFGEQVLVEFCVERIHAGRSDNEAERIRRHCTIVDSLKNPAEADRLRLIYGNLFWLIGILLQKILELRDLQTYHRTILIFTRLMTKIMTRVRNTGSL